MNTFLWILQSLVALVFIIPGLYKIIYSKEELMKKGMGGVEGLPIPTIRFIGAIEILGAIGIILPMLLNILPVLTIISAIGFAIIMFSAAIVNYKRGEYKKIGMNIIILLICIFIAYGRIEYPI